MISCRWRTTDSLRQGSSRLVHGETSCGSPLIKSTRTFIAIPSQRLSVEPRRPAISSSNHALIPWFGTRTTCGANKSSPCRDSSRCFQTVGSASASRDEKTNSIGTARVKVPEGSAQPFQSVQIAQTSLSRRGTCAGPSDGRRSRTPRPGGSWAGAGHAG